MAAANRSGSRKSTRAINSGRRATRDPVESLPSHRDEPPQKGDSGLSRRELEALKASTSDPTVAAIVKLIQELAIGTQRIALAVIRQAVALGVGGGSGFSEIEQSITEFIEQQDHALGRLKRALKERIISLVAQENIPATLSSVPGSGERLPAAIGLVDEQIEEGRLIDAELRAALAALVEKSCPEWPTDRRGLVVANFEKGFHAAASDKRVGPIGRDGEVEATRPTWPQWLDKHKPAELRGLTSPRFLKAVHADLIAPDGTVRKLDVRRRDPDLMDCIENYISKRKRRKKDLGDADGLNFVAHFPGRNLVPREVTFRKSFGKAPPEIIEGQREYGRTAAKLRRQRRRNPNP
jgi:hypothetical protein